MNSHPPDILEMPISTVTKRLSMDANRWAWVEKESARLGLSPHVFISTLLEWAEDADITHEADLGLLELKEVA